MVGRARQRPAVRPTDRQRFVTSSGSGGVGKTTVAVAVGHHLMEAFAGAVLFVDLGMLSDPDLVAHGACRRCWGCRCGPTIPRPA